MIPSNPLLAVYVLGAMGFAILLLFAFTARPMALGFLLGEADRARVPRWMVYATLLVAYTVAWPITAAVLVATSRRD
jgi:hypothetical protein